MSPSELPVLRLALIGAGAMGSLHARVIGQHPDTRLVAVIDPDEATGRQLAERHNAVWGRALDDARGVDAIIVASPTASHGLWAHEVLAAGLPLFVEKPLTATVEATRHIVDLAARADLPLLCGFVERYNAALLVAGEIIKEPLQFQAVRHSPYAPRIRGGVGLDLLIHDVDLALRFFGTEAVHIRATAGHFHPASDAAAEDVVEAQLSFARGGVATLSASRIAQRKLRQIRLLDLERTLEIDLIRQDITIYRHVGNTFDDRGAYRQQTVIDIPVIAQRREPLVAQLDHFVALIRGEQDHVAERATILAPHEVTARILADAAGH